MFLIMVFILSQLQLPGKGCLRYAEPCRESIEVGKADCAMKRDGDADDPGGEPTIGKQFGVEAGNLTQPNKHTVAGLKAESSKEKESRNGTDEKTNRHLETNTTAVAQLVESSVKNLIKDPEEKRHTKGREKKRQRSMMKHRGIDKESIKMHKHTVTRLLEEYNTHCGDESGQNVTYCERILVLLEKEMRPPKADKHRKTRHILEPNFLCWNIVPFRIKWYNPMTQICCNGIHERISGNEICCGNEVVNETDTLGCCGMETYSTDTSLCCGDRLYENSNASLQCCGRTTYDSSAGLRCCKGRMFDSARQFCCDNNVLYDNIGKRNNHGGCCGSKRYDSRCYSCNVTSVNPTIYPIFERETQACCDGRIKTIKQNKTECCGKRLFDPTAYHCVNDSSLLVLRSSSDRQDITTKPHVNSPYLTVSPVVGTLDTGETNFEENVSKNSKETRTTTMLWIILISVAGVVSAIVMAIVSTVLYRKRCSKRPRCMYGEQQMPRLCSNDVIHSPSNEHILRVSSEFTESTNNEQILQVSSEFTESTNNVQILQVSSEFTESTNNEQIQRVPSDTTNSVVRESIDNEEPLQSFRVAIRSSTSEIMTDSSFLSKGSDRNLQNLTSELSNDAETQTFETKRSNVRDTFGNIYQHSCYLDRLNRTLNWDKSDCKMSLPESAVENHKVEAYASSFDYLPSIYEKFSLPPETRLVSPVVEYRLPGMKLLDDFALVELPFIGKPDQIEVWKCPSDEGMYQTTECRSVPILERADINSDLWCLIEEGKVRVYTKSFSIFFCTCQEQPRNLCLRAFLFGSYKKILERKEVRLSLYITDELHTFKDYNQRMFELESLAERELKCDQEISLHKELNERDYLDISMSMVENDRATWDHKLHPTKVIPLEDKHKNVYLSQVARCCNSLRSLPNQVSWYLENKPDTQPKDTVQCLVDMNCCLADEQSPPINTSLYIDELQLRAKDREHVPSEEDRAADLKDFLNHHLDEKGKTRLNEELKRRNKLRRHSDECQDLCKSLDCLYNDMYPAAFTRTVASVLDDIHFDKVIDQLEDRKYISKAHLRRSLQACAENSLNHTIQGFENRRLLPVRHVVAEEDRSQNLSVQQLHAPECRRELEETITTSFDNRTPNQQEREDIFATDESDENLAEEPLLEAPHLEDSDDESDTELKQIVTSL